MVSMKYLALTVIFISEFFLFFVDNMLLAFFPDQGLSRGISLTQIGLVLATDSIGAIYPSSFAS